MGLEYVIKFDPADAIRGLKGMSQGLNNMHSTISRVSDSVTKFAGAWGDLESSKAPFSDADIDIATILEPVKHVIEHLSSGIEKLTSHIGRIEKFKKAIAGLSPTMIKVIAVVGAVIAVIAALAAVFIYLWNNNEAFRENVTKIWEKIKEFGISIFETLKEAFEDIWEQIQLTAEVVWGRIEKLWDKFGDHIMIAAEFVWNTIGTIIETVIGTIQDIIGLVLSVIRGDWEEAWERVKSIFSRIWSAIQDIVSDYIKTLKNLYSGIVLWIVNKIKELRQRAIDRFEVLKNGAIQLFRDLWNGIKGVFMSFISGGIIGLINDYILDPFFDINLRDIGRDIVTGLWNGIKSMGSRLKNNVTSFIGDTLPGPMKKVLGIASPSRLFKQFGGWTMEGLSIGIDKESNSVLDSVKNVANGMISIGGGVEMPKIKASRMSTGAPNNKGAQPVAIVIEQDGREQARWLLEHIDRDVRLKTGVRI